jgi:hypothetical protein
MQVPVKSLFALKYDNTWTGQHENCISSLDFSVVIAGCKVLGVIAVDSQANRFHQEKWRRIQTL